VENGIEDGARLGMEHSRRLVSGFRAGENGDYRGEWAVFSYARAVRPGGILPDIDPRSTVLDGPMAWLCGRMPAR
jgi:hypothetical protein